MFIVPPAKEVMNLKNHRISLWRMLDLRDGIARHVVRHGEARTVTVGLIGGKVYMAVTTVRHEHDVRAISLHRANTSETTRYRAARKTQA